MDARQQRVDQQGDAEPDLAITALTGVRGLASPEYVGASAGDAGDVVADTEETKVMERGDLRMDPLRHAVSWKGRDVSLTVTEFLLLQALAQRPGFVKSRDQLMDVAYDDQVYVDDRTIDSHIKRLRKKMRTADDEFSAIETLYGIGYRYNEE